MVPALRPRLEPLRKGDTAIYVGMVAALAEGRILPPEGPVKPVRAIAARHRDTIKAVKAWIDGGMKPRAERRDQWRDPRPDIRARWWWNSRVPGDCDDYAVGYLLELIQRGVPDGAVYLVRGRVPNDPLGNGQHVLVVVDTDEGAVVLDNLKSTIVTWPARLSGPDRFTPDFASDASLKAWRRVTA